PVAKLLNFAAGVEHDLGCAVTEIKPRPYDLSCVINGCLLVGVGSIAEVSNVPVVQKLDNGVASVTALVVGLIPGNLAGTVDARFPVVRLVLRKVFRHATCPSNDFGSRPIRSVGAVERHPYDYAMIIDVGQGFC